MNNYFGTSCHLGIWICLLVSAATPTAATAQVVINEIFYHCPDELDLEYVELLNSGEDEVDLSGWKLSGGIKFEFPPGNKLIGGGFVVVANNSELLKEFYEIEPIGEFKKSLANSGDKVNLKDRDGRVVESVTYTDRAPWPVSADGYSASLERVYAKGTASTPSNWEASELSSDYDRLPAGTPGRANSVAADALPPSIKSVQWKPSQPKPGAELTVSAKIEKTDTLQSVVLHYRLLAPGKKGEERTIKMSKGDDGRFIAQIKTGDEQNRILSFWVVAKSKEGGVASRPRVNDLRPSYSVYVNDAVATDKIPALQFFHIGDNEFAAGERYREEQRRMRGGFGRRGFGGPRGFGGRGGRFGGYPRTRLLPQGFSAVVYTDPKTGKSEVYDYVNVVRRKSGWKVRFHKDRPLLGMTTINVLYEPNEATILNESLAYELYELAGNPSYQSGYMRLAINGRPVGHHLYFEQPNGNFFRRNEINNKGDLYKLIWMGNAEISRRISDEELLGRFDIAGRHEKKSNRHEGYQDLIKLIEKLEGANTDEAMWKIIEENFELDNVVNYFAVNSLISHWDGFFNNYFVYYDRKGSKKWSLYPWDQDSTWSQRGGNPDELYEMPLYFGAAGATPDGIVDDDEVDRPAGFRERRGFRGFGRGFGGRGRGFGWWRDGGEISKPLLANPQFYKRFLKRLDELTESVFKEEIFGVKIDALRDSLEPEVRLRARIRGDEEAAAVAQLDRTARALHEHLVERRAFIRKKLQERR